jgi:hypothetical protein
MNATYELWLNGKRTVQTSAFASLDDAAHYLRGWKNRGAFGTSLLAAFDKRRCSRNQAAWIHKLASDLHSKSLSDAFYATSEARREQLEAREAQQDR